MAITDVFMPMPIARSTVDDVPLPQMQRSAQQLGPLQQQPSVTSMLKDKAMDMGTEKALKEGSKFGMDKLAGMFAKPTMMPMSGNPALAGTTVSTGSTGLLSGLTSGAGAGAGAGAMSALGTAVPYIGMGLLAGKAFGLFKRGGHVGPLALK
jgi:hypothetical protein